MTLNEIQYSLTILDMSFNSVRDMSPVSCCGELRELYLAQNKLRKIQGIRHMKHLKILDLGANRIRVKKSYHLLYNITILYSWKK